MTTTELIELLKKHEKDSYGESRQVEFIEKNKRGFLAQKVPTQVTLEMTYNKNLWNDNSLCIVFNNP